MRLIIKALLLILIMTFAMPQHVDARRAATKSTRTATTKKSRPAAQQWIGDIPTADRIGLYFDNTMNAKSETTLRELNAHGYVEQGDGSYELPGVCRIAFSGGRWEICAEVTIYDAEARAKWVANMKQSFLKKKDRSAFQNDDGSWLICYDFN